MQDKNKILLKKLISQMLTEEYLLEFGEYHLIKLEPAIGQLKDTNTRVLIKVSEEEKKPAPTSAKLKKAKPANSFTSIGSTMFEELRTLRLEIAREEHVPPYIIFSDKTLNDMCSKMPTTKEEMLRVSGVGEVKYSKYGDRFLTQILKYAVKH